MIRIYMTNDKNSYTYNIIMTYSDWMPWTLIIPLFLYASFCVNIYINKCQL